MQGDDGIQGEVVGVCGEVGEELEGPAETDEVGGRLTPRPPLFQRGGGREAGEEAVVVASATTEATAFGGEGDAGDDGKVDGGVVGKGFARGL